MQTHHWRYARVFLVESRLLSRPVMVLDCSICLPASQPALSIHSHPSMSLKPHMRYTHPGLSKLRHPQSRKMCALPRSSVILMHAWGRRRIGNFPCHYGITECSLLLASISRSRSRRSRRRHQTQGSLVRHLPIPPSLPLYLLEQNQNPSPRGTAGAAIGPVAINGPVYYCIISCSAAIPLPTSQL